MLLFSLLLTITAAQANDQCFGRGEDSTGNNNPMCEAQFIPPCLRSNSPLLLGSGPDRLSVILGTRAPFFRKKLRPPSKISALESEE